MHTPLIFSPSFLGLSPPRRLNNRDKRPAWPSGRTVPSFCWSCTRHADAPVVVQMPLAPSKRVHASASKHESKTRTPIAVQVLPIVSRSVEKPRCATRRNTTRLCFRSTLRRQDLHRPPEPDLQARNSSGEIRVPRGPGRALPRVPCCRVEF